MSTLMGPFCAGRGLDKIVAGLMFLLLSNSARAASPTYSTDAVGWRFWGAADGLTEAYSTVLSQLGGGRIAVRHGDVNTLEILDGFGATSVPDGHWLGRLYEDDSGALFTFNDRGIAVYRGSAWTL